MPSIFYHNQPQLANRFKNSHRKRHLIGKGVYKLLWLLVLLIAGFQMVSAQPFITRWQTQPNYIQLTITKSGPVSYTWTSIPAGQSGSGTVSGASNLLYIGNLPNNTIIELSIDTTNFRAFRFVNNGLTSVEQWGGVHWTNMSRAFSGGLSLTMNANDVPDLSQVESWIRCFMEEICLEI